MKQIENYLPFYLGCEVEQWKSIPNYPFYEASNLGKVRSLDKPVRHNYGGVAIKKGKVLSQELNDKGYYRTALTINGQYKSISVHILVALAWHINSENKPCVNHKNGIKTDNSESNIEWCTQSENVKHAWDSGLRKPHQVSPRCYTKLNELNTRPITLTNLSTGKISYFASISKCADFLIITHSAISVAIKRNSLIQKQYKAFYNEKY